jgi:hypothetical protein
MTFIDISQSDYIFKQEVLLGIFGIVFCIALVIYAFVCLRKGRTSGDDYIRKAEDFRAIILTLFSLSIWIFGFMPVVQDSYKLKHNGVETEGKTLKWVFVKGKHISKYVKYSFIANGKTFIGQSGIVYSGKEIQGIVCPEGKYVVIYDKNNPSNSIMDFKRSLDNKAANTNFVK